MKDCFATLESFAGALQSGPLLDNDWRCRVCHRLAAEHPSGSGPSSLHPPLSAVVAGVAAYRSRARTRFVSHRAFSRLFPNFETRLLACVACAHGLPRAARSPGPSATPGAAVSPFVRPAPPFKCQRRRSACGPVHPRGSPYLPPYSAAAGATAAHALRAISLLV
jgi:hypothetical protein